MAVASVKCKCATCGKEFVYSKTCHNRKEADSFEEWAEGRFDECPECRKARWIKERDEKAKALIEKYNFPAIEGMSEKQIAYANTLRNRWLGKDSTKEDLERFSRLQEKMRSADFEDKLQKLADSKFDGDTETALEHLYERYWVLTVYKVYNETNASKIIDALRCE